jgi:hypothetical protein
MPRQERYPCSGWGFSAMIRATSLAVSGPVSAAQASIREGVHSRYALCDAGMCSSSVVKPPFAKLLGWEATL